MTKSDFDKIYSETLSTANKLLEMPVGDSYLKVIEVFNNNMDQINQMIKSDPNTLKHNKEMLEKLKEVHESVLKKMTKEKDAIMEYIKGQNAKVNVNRKYYNTKGSAGIVNRKF